MTIGCVRAPAALGCVALVSSVAAASPWATEVIAYVEGTGVDPAYTNPAAALGEPTRFTGVGAFPGAVTPFNPPWMADEIVSIGPGGSLTVRFSQPVENSPHNPFGIDLLIFGNTGYIDTSFPNGVAGGLFGAGNATVEVSQTGATWHAIPGITIGSPFPTLGYSDLADPYATSPGSILSDFRRPVDPMFDAAGRSFAEIVQAYDGSGGGTGIDIGAVGLSSISYVRISNPASAGQPVGIDAFAVVPGPGAGALFMLGAATLFPRRRR